MTFEQIKAIPVKDLAAKNCLLFLWATMPKLPEILDVIDTWGFKYTTCAFSWIKLNPKGWLEHGIERRKKFIILRGGVYSGMGSWTNGNAELCLLAKRGRPNRLARNVKQVLLSPVGRHSAKPAEARERIIQLAGDLPRIELFAREKVPGWDAIGIDLDGSDVLTVFNARGCY